ncbi:hypothetical protein FNF29_00844 [Cafeteria roenbergensis]|uniref:Uncharacterized protein n=1 Tax=Cafeteria roenbergensis TaxID=33653 RepID=A0A5A8D3X6_CAFRO|nr:hypothetical protein FNF29_00844 [Cafeteria roenbergensis]KAA0158970.1 hypothetical protein FNF31_05140 [Cafeteria roenbergensis]KAA0165139.1 hypothetical protein FNF28_03538 [Cafeteria roenbergensis]|eukprot:KAA0156733.1 hypothetical protein FNF29_00844 [Cafeteria roenbergensis]
MLRADSGLEALVRPGVLVMFEVLDHGPSLPPAATEAGQGFYPVAWGYVRLVAEDDSPRVDVDARPLVEPREKGGGKVGCGNPLDGNDGGPRQRGPPGWKDYRKAPPAGARSGGGGGGSEAGDASAPETPVAAADTRLTGAAATAAGGASAGGAPFVHGVTAASRRQLDHKGWRMQVRMYNWLPPSSAEILAHSASIAAAARRPGARPGLHLVPTCPAALQYRLRRREEAPFTITVSLSAALVAPRRTQAEPVIARILRGPVAVSAPSSAPSGPDRSGPPSPAAAGAAARLSRHRLTLADFQGADAAPEETAKPRREVAEAAARALLRRRRPTDPCRVPTAFMRTVPSGRTGCMCLRFTEDGAFLAAACADLAERSFPVRIFDPDTGELRGEATGHTDLVYDVKWQPSVRRPRAAAAPAASGAEDDDTFVDGHDGSATGFSSAASGMAGSAAGPGGRGTSRSRRRGLVTASADGTARVWQFVERRRAVKCVALLSLTPPSYVYTAVFHPLRPDLVVTGSFDGILRLWQLAQDESPSARPGPRTPRRPPAAPGSSAADGVSDGDGDDGRPAWAFGGGVFPPRCRGVLRGFLGAPPGVAAGSTARRAGASLLIRDADDSAGGTKLMSPGLQTPARTKVGPAATPGGASVGGFAPSHAAPPSRAGRASPHKSHVNCLVFHPSGGRLFSADGEGTIVIWDSAAATANPMAYKPVIEVKHHVTAGLSIVDMQFRPGREHLVVLTHRSGLRIFQVLPRALQLLRSLPGLSCAGSRLQLCCSPDGRYVLAGSESGRCGIWDADTGREVLATPGRVKRLGAVGFDAIMSATAWHPSQHVIGIAAFGDGAPVTLYCHEHKQ